MLNKNRVFLRTPQAIFEYESAILNRNRTCYKKTLYKVQTILENKWYSRQESDTVENTEWNRIPLHL